MSNAEISFKSHSAAAKAEIGRGGTLSESQIGSPRVHVLTALAKANVRCHALAKAEIGRGSSLSEPQVGSTLILIVLIAPVTTLANKNYSVLFAVPRNRAYYIN